LPGYATVQALKQGTIKHTVVHSVTIATAQQKHMCQLVKVNSLLQK